MFRALMSGAALLALVACGTTEPGSPTYISATVGGAAWRGQASDGAIAYSVDAPTGAGFVYSIGSRSTAFGSELLILDLPNPPALGVYSLGGDTAIATFGSCPTQDIADCSYWRAIPGDPGTLEIATIDTSTGMIAGTFAFRGHFLGDSAGPAKLITQGRFVIHFTPGT